MPAPDLTLITLWGGSGRLSDAQGVAVRLLAFMDGHLESRDWLVGDRATIADLACYAYIAGAAEGRVPLDPHPAVRRWLERVEALPNFLPMPHTPLPETV